MQTRIREHIHRHVVGYVAVFLALGGTAYATHPGGANTVSSVDIINGEVKAADIGQLEVGSGELKTGAVTTAKIFNGGVTGADVDESTLDEVPSALYGGFGRSMGAGACNPESTTFVNCELVSLDLPAPARVLLIGQTSGRPDNPPQQGVGQCRIGSAAGGPFLDTTTTIKVESGSIEDVESVSPVVVSAPLPAGEHFFGIDCNEGSDGINYFAAGITAVAISPS